MAGRVNKLREIIKRERLDAVLITDPLNVYYLSGFKFGDASLLITGEANYIITDFRYKEDGRRLSGFRLKLIKDTFRDTLKELLRGAGARRLGFEGEAVPYSRAVALRRALGTRGVRLAALGREIEQLRMLKDADEIKEIRRAVAVAGQAFRMLKIRAGISERRIARELEGLIMECKGDAPAFEIIAASGRNSSKPHAGLTDRVIGKNDLVLVDFGVKAGMYNCDLTRVRFLGKIQRVLYDIYNICIEAQRQAIEAVRPGVTTGYIDKIGRDYIASRGYGRYFGHSLGHGIGLGVHELPRLFPKGEEVLRPNMVFTVEPGIYMENLGGARIEDMVLVTGKGCEVLTDAIPK